MRQDEAVLLDIAQAARLVTAFIGNMTRDEFLDDLKTQSAVLHQLLVLGEAVKRLSQKFRAIHPTIPWNLIAGMRDHLIHAYDTVDLEEVWKTSIKDLPSLLSYIEPLLPDNPVND